jgi:hypothetical protein
MNVYGDVVDDRMKEAHSKVAALVFTSTAPEKGSSAQRSDDSSNVGSASRLVLCSCCVAASKPLKRWRREWDSNLLENVVSTT